MKRTFFLLTVLMLMASCGGDKNSDKAGNTPATGDTVAAEQQAEQAAAPQVAVKPDAPCDDNSSFIVISKKDLALTVYARSNNDTIALATFPVCMGKNKGDKQGKGDMRTPESPAGKPFTIAKIQDASTWTHDFGDGRGSILAYGNWFLRLDTPGHSGIGIHGSTNNENTVPGRASEGCIRLLDKDIITLKEKYARVGMPVIIKGEDQGLLPFEQKCLAQ